MKNGFRLSLLQQKLTEGKWLLIEDPIDLFYLTGLKLSKGSLVVGPHIVLFVDGRYEASAREKLSIQILSDKDFSPWALSNCKNGLHFDPSKTLHERCLWLCSELKEIKLLPLKHAVEEMRMIKEEEEIQLLKKSAEVNAKALIHTTAFFEEGISEKELAAIYQMKTLELGAEKMAFEPIVAFGDNSAFPHHRAGSRKLKKGEIILIDVGVIKDDYASDMTRCFFFEHPHPQLKHLYEQLKIFHSQLLKELKAGISIYACDVKARSWIKSLGYQAAHSLGHGVGLEVHEAPRIVHSAPQNGRFLENMVITIEPGVYLPGLGGLRYEDTLVIKKEGILNFYEDVKFN